MIQFAFPSQAPQEKRWAPRFVFNGIVGNTIASVANGHRDHSHCRNAVQWTRFARVPYTVSAHERTM
jgi:hypothetical protein